MEAIKLTNGMLTQVDDEDYEKFGHVKWQLVAGGRYVGRTFQEDRKRRMVYLHRLIAGAEPGEDVHHCDGDKLNNQRANLEIIGDRAAHLFHHMVSEGPRTPGYKGVHEWKEKWGHRNKRWVARIKVDGKSRTIGFYHTGHEAAFAYDRKALELWGDTAYLNFPCLRWVKDPSKLAWEILK